jgi:hypothetical protein
MKEIDHRIILVISIVALATLFSFHDAYAISLGWIPGNFTTTNGLAIWSGGPLPQNPPVIPNQFEITDGNYSNNGVTDKINVLLNSTSDPTGITLTLTETGDTGHFYNTNFIFSNGTGLHDISSTQIVGISGYGLNINPNVIEKVISGPSNPNSGIWVISSSDFNGIYLNLTETGPNTGVFTSPLKFTVGPSVNGSAIKANPGDTVSIVDVYQINHGGGNYDDTAVEIVGPNSDTALGALPAKWNDDITIVYKGVKLLGTINVTTDPGGGGGGLIRPSLVLDILAAIGGGNTVQPPSFGGSSYHFSDGLTFTHGTNKTTFDISKYNQDLQKQVMVKGVQVNMTFKTFESYDINGLVHMGLYLIPRGQDMITPNSIAAIEWDKGEPIVVKDPNRILFNATVDESIDDRFHYTKFSFIPTKSYEKMSFLVRAWNDHMETTDVRIHDAIDTVAPVKALPEGVVMYSSFADVQSALYKDQFYKPEIMAHIHDVKNVFPDNQGKIYWLYDTVNHFVTLVISDNSDNELFSYKSPLEPFEIEKKGDYKFMHFTVEQLNRWNTDQIQKAMKVEEYKAMTTQIVMKITRDSKW